MTTQWHYKLQYLFIGALCNKWQCKKRPFPQISNSLLIQAKFSTVESNYPWLFLLSCTRGLHSDLANQAHNQYALSLVRKFKQ